MSLFTCSGGEVVHPELVLVSRLDGGNLVVNPPRPVWDRSELTPDELALWSFLVAATARAMLETLPQLEHGCINYWDAGNWSLNFEAAPVGLKDGRVHRRVHLHLLGRSRQTLNPSLRWGEAPIFPDYADRAAWAAGNEPLTIAECEAIVARTRHLLKEKYGVD